MPTARVISEVVETEHAEANAEPNDEPASESADDEPATESMEGTAPENDIIFGDVFTIESAGVEHPLNTLLSAIDSQPQPNSPPIGRVQVHVGEWQIRVIREVPSRFERASVVGRDDVCETRVVRTRELHAHHVSPSDDGPPGL